MQNTLIIVSLLIAATLCPLIVYARGWRQVKARPSDFIFVVVVCVTLLGSVSTALAMEDGEKTQSEAVEFFQTTGTPPSQVNGKWFTDSASADAFGQREIGKMKQADIGRAVAGDYVVTIDGERFGSQHALAGAARQDVEDANAQGNNMIAMQEALKMQADMREARRIKHEREIAEEGLTEAEKAVLRRDYNEGNELTEATTREMVQAIKERPEPVVPREPSRAFVSVENSGTVVREAGSNTLVSRGQDS